MKRVILETPFRGKTDAETASNVEFARRCMADSLRKNEAPFASHLLYTQPGILDDKIPAERALGIEAGLFWGFAAKATVVYLDRGVSDGMRHGIKSAVAAWRPIDFRLLDGAEAVAKTMGDKLMAELFPEKVDKQPAS